MTNADTGRPRGCSRAAVEAAVDQLAAMGLTPSCRTVQEITGGSYRDIAPLLKEIKARRAQLKTTTADASVPSPEAQAMFERFCADLAANVSGALVEQQKAFDTTVRSYQAELDELTDVIVGLEADMADIRAAVAERDARLAAADAHARAQAAEVDALRQELETQRRIAQALQTAIGNRAGEAPVGDTTEANAIPEIPSTPSTAGQAADTCPTAVATGEGSAAAQADVADTGGGVASPGASQPEPASTQPDAGSEEGSADPQCDDVEQAASDVQPSLLTQLEHGKGKGRDVPRRRAS